MKISFEKWSPNLESSGQTSKPVWTKLLLDGSIICNSVEQVDWITQPVQVEICEFCGISECNSNGYVSISRIMNNIIWTEPSLREVSYKTTGYCLTNKKPIIFCQNDWEQIFSRFESFVSFNEVEKAKKWQILSFAFLQSPICGIQNINNYYDKISNEIIYIDGIELEHFYKILGNALDPEQLEYIIPESDIYIFDDSFHNITLFFSNGDEWSSFCLKDDFLFIKIDDIAVKV